MAAQLLRPQRLAVLLAAALASPAHADDTPTARLGEITVDAKRDERAVVIDSREMEKRNVTDMANMARYEPLVNVPAAASGGANIWDGAGNTGFNIRGVEGNRVSLDLDGIPLPDAAPRPDGSSVNSFGIGRDYFDPETFREVRIESGTSPASAGSPGLGGSVSFATKSPEDYVSATRPLYGEYKFGYTEAAHSRLHALTAAAQQGALQMLALYAHRDGEQQESKGSVPPNPDDWNSDALLAKLIWRVSPSHKLGFTADAYRNEHERMFNNKLGPSYPAGSTQDSRTHRNRFSVDHEFTGATSWFDMLETRVYVQDSKVEDHTLARYITGGQPTSRSIDTGFYNKSKGLTSNATKQLGAHTLAYGVSFEDLESRRPWREDRTVLATGAHQITNKNRMADMDTTKFAAYVCGELTLGDGFALTPGVRGEYRELKPKNLQNYVVAVPGAGKEIQKEDDSYLAPSLMLSKALGTSMSAYASYTRGARIPSAAERTGTYDSFSYTGAGTGYATLGNPNLKKERSDAYELGLKGHPDRSLTISAKTFYTSYKDFIDYVSQPADPVNYPTITFGLFRPENIGKAAVWGGEVSGRYISSGLPGFSATMAAGASRSRSENTRNGVKGELPSTLPYKASAGLAWDDTAGRGGASLVAVHTRGKQARADVTSVNTQPTYFDVPSATVLDLTAYWNVGKNAILSGGVYNLADKKYWDYASSRTLAAGSTAALQAEIERQARPGRNVAVNFKLMY
jgi:hemoglobin/transferrin/lactoferrin receptor protein